ncbi:MAG: tandem-95 repeat protein, partial [Deltaproteobacteria bacterium]|nr:tandem-95 repeat protein [Deltaproteobacteria bacterium]
MSTKNLGFRFVAHIILVLLASLFFTVPDHDALGKDRHDSWRYSGDNGPNWKTSGYDDRDHDWHDKCERDRQKDWDKDNVIKNHLGWFRKKHIRLDKPILVAPEGEITTRRPLYQWQPVEGADRYGLIVHRVTRPRVPVYIKFNLSDTEQMHPWWKRLRYDTDYFFVVIAYDQKKRKISPFSDRMYFRVKEEAPNVPPVAHDQAVLLEEDVTTVVTLTATDADNDSLTYQVVDSPAHGTLTGTPPDLTYTPEADYNGADSFTFKASDGTADSSIATVSLVINPVNDAPVSNDQSVTTDEDISVSLTLTGSDSDNDPLTFLVDSGPSHGTLTGTPPDLVYTPEADYNSTDSFTFKANDGTVDSNIATVTLTINPVNDDPIAVDDTLSTVMDTPVIAPNSSLLANDTDVDEDSLSISGFTQPANGAVTDNGDGSFTYTPNTGFTGPDSFTYTASDGNGGTDSAIVSVTVNQTVPSITISADPAKILAGGSSVLTWSTSHADSVSIDQGIGIVSLSGTTIVSPLSTTTYTITATGSGGTSDESVTVQVIMPPADVDLGVNQDEQQGGGGLVGETVRVLNGNVLEFRSDVSFPTPNRLGLSLLTPSITAGQTDQAPWDMAGPIPMRHPLMPHSILQA